MNLIKTFFQCFHALKKTALFRFQSIGKTIGFVFFMMFLTSLPIGLIMFFEVNNIINYTTNEFIEDTPDFHFENGILISDMDEAIIQEHDSNTYIFDTTGNIHPKDILKYENAVALLPNEVIYVRNEKLQKFEYDMLLPETMTKVEFIDLINKVKQWLFIITPFLFIIMYLYFTALKFIDICILAFIGLALKKWMYRYLNYSQLWRMSVYAITIPTSIFSLSLAFQIMIPSGFLFYWLLAIYCLMKVINGVPKKRT
ncbi:DUF1189 domain-containing protein [Bacillus solimangrovi]|uniref:DUF1189 domain-containing protein n=1 Tax=Bacillus solimangrovi TaxID=1305675 RepID=A0A1E5LI40_9BACI|nr:DUF1189 domain-containing protein [Bacillus solimangrovi]OEH93731.1 hypothetical protein BFG57_11900 [Bacillus solimangrovi]